MKDKKVEVKKTSMLDILSFVALLGIITGIVIGAFVTLWLLGRFF